MDTRAPQGKPPTPSEITARSARQLILKMTARARASHVGSSLSVVDILSVLYSGAAEVSAANSNEADRDIIILSKGHSAAALYAVLSILDFMPLTALDSYCANGSPLGGHVTSNQIKGIELSTGSLGHGLPYGVGIALSRKREEQKGRIFVIMSDGECNEGTTWESALIANHFNLNNLTVIIDRNGIQSLQTTEATLKLEPFAMKWTAFGWNVLELNGHSHKELFESLIPASKPTVLIARTTKGYGISFMEDRVEWHYRSPNLEELQRALNELGE